MTGGPAIAAGNSGFAHLIDNSRPWYKNPRLRVLNFWIALMLITSSTNGYDGSMMNGLQSLPQWNFSFHDPKGGKLGLLNAIQNIGGLAAYPLSPYVADGIGRRKAILLGASIMIIGVVVQTASQSVGMFIGARFLIGFGLTFATAAAPLLVTEVAYPSQRAQATSIYNSLWYLGSIIAAWATYGTFKLESSWAWRLPSALQGLPSVLQIFLVWFIPESPRWLVSKGREQEALSTLAYYHANGNEQDPLVEYEFEEIKAALSYEREVASNIGWLSFVKNPGNRKRMRIILALAFFSQWSGNGLVSYYLNKVFDIIGITDPTEQLLINGFLNIFNFGIAITAGLMCNVIGRRRLFMASTIGMLLFWTGQTISFRYAQDGNKAAGKAVVAFIFLFYGAYDIAFTPLIVSYTVEILPYALRAKGFTIFNFAVSLSLIFNQYVNPIALNSLKWKYYLVYCVWLVFEVVFCYIYIIETKNLSLEETAALFDGDDALANLGRSNAPAGTHISEGSDNEKAEVEEISEKGE